MDEHARPARGSRRYPSAALWVAVGLGLAALVWVVIGVPTFVKYPTDLEATPRYEGTFRAFVDLSLVPLDEPLELPLDIERRIEAIGDESGASRVVVRETVDQVAGDLVDTTQENQYVMDRSTIENVEDDRAFAFEPDNTVDRSGAYRVNLPFDTSRDESYEIYKNEIGGTYRLVPDEEDPTSDVEGLELANFRVSDLEERPLTGAYLAQLGEVVPIPESLTLDELRPFLLDLGLDVDALVAALAPVLTPEDAATLGELAADPIPLQYVLSVEGDVGIEPVTGAEVVVRAVETVGARPQLTNLPALQDVLSRYPDVPAAAEAGAALEDLADAPAVPLFEFDYAQTPASVADIADEARSQRRLVLAARVWLPLALVAAAVLSLAIGLAVYLRRRRVGPAGAARPSERPTAATPGTGEPPRRSSA